MRIGEVAAKSGVSPRALRYYEEQQLLSALRSDSGQRYYTDEVIERVQLIRRLYSAGLNSKAIAELLPCVHTGVATPAMLERLSVERARIDQQIDDLTDARDRLGKVIDVALDHSGVPAVDRTRLKDPDGFEPRPPLAS